MSFFLLPKCVLLTRIPTPPPGQVWVYAFAALAVHILIVETIKWVLVRNVFANMAHKKQIEDERAGRAVFYVDV